MFVQSIFDSIAAGVYTGDIGHSLRFRGAQYLYRNDTTGGYTQSAAVSLWIKRGTLGTVQVLMSGGSSSSNYGQLLLDAADTLSYYEVGSGAVKINLTTSAVLRDPTNFVHIVLVFDLANATASERIKIYLNGMRQTLTGTTPPNGYTSNFLYIGHKYIGCQGYSAAPAGSYFNGHIARPCLAGGTTPTVSTFGRYNTEINEWVSRKLSEIEPYASAYGGGYLLEFDDAASLTALGNDESTNNADWTLAGGFSLTAGTTYDHMLDVPGNSYATLNPLSLGSTVTLSNGNLTMTEGGTYATTATSMSFNQGKLVAEMIVQANTYAGTFGICRAGYSPTVRLGFQANTWAFNSDGSLYYNSTGIGAGSGAWGTGDVIRCEFDVAALTITFFRNNTQHGTQFTAANSGLTAGDFFFAVGHINSTSVFCSGAAPLHASAAYRSDAGGYFRDAPTTGFKALCQANLPDPAILNPEQHHNVYTVTKSGNTNFTLDWDGSTYDTYFEIKRRNSTSDWYNVDGLRGYDKILKSNSTSAETTDANVISVSGTTCTLKSTLADGTYVISAWKAGLTASRQTNTDGSITSTVSRNVTSGFAIVTYTGTGATATVGHGLGKAPKRMEVKDSTNAYNWYVYTTSTGSNLRFEGLNTTSAATSQPGQYTTTSTLIENIPNIVSLNTLNATMVVYCHAEIPGYSKFGSYPGNGSADGPYVDLGFKAKWSQVKNSSVPEGWEVIDAVRDTYNVAKGLLESNNTGAENTAGDQIDIDALALKVRNTRAAYNTNTNIYIYSAYADVAGKYALGR